MKIEIRDEDAEGTCFILLKAMATLELSFEESGLLHKIYNQIKPPSP